MANIQSSGWQVSIPDPIPDSGMIQIFHLAFTPALATTPARVDRLTAEEIRRAGNFYHTIDRNRFVVGRSILRSILAKLYSSVPRDIPLTLRNGRPVLASDTGQSIGFNISHGGDSVMVAISYDSAIGVDVEPCRELSDMDRVAERVMTSSEHQHYLSLRQGEKNSAFYRLWVRKESLLKCLGTGFQIEPNCISVGHMEQSETGAYYLQQAYWLVQGVIPIFRRPHYWAIAYPKPYSRVIEPKKIELQKVEIQE